MTKDDWSLKDGLLFKLHSSFFMLFLNRPTVRKINSLIKLKPPLAHHPVRRDDHHSASGAVAEAQLYVARREERKGGSGFLEFVCGVDQLPGVAMRIARRAGQSGENIQSLPLAAIGVKDGAELSPLIGRSLTERVADGHLVLNVPARTAVAYLAR